MYVRRSLRILFVLMFIIVRFSSAQEVQVNPILDALDQWNLNSPQEKVHLHTDKSNYIIGDTIWLKAYITVGGKHQLSALSGAVYIDLIYGNDSICQSIKLPVIAGTAKGNLSLSDTTLMTGTYRIRAYTRWMQNFDEHYFFNKAITLSAGDAGIATIEHKSFKNDTSSALNATINYGDKDVETDVQFFPEGGSLIRGVQSRVAFKAVGSNGLGQSVKGIIVDNDGNEITRFESMHLGMGFFNLKPGSGKQYSAKITLKNGLTKLFELPKTNDEGYQMAIYNNVKKDSILVRISYPDSNISLHVKKVLLIGQSSGTVYFDLLQMLSNYQTSVWIPTTNIPSGILQITLFTEEGNPLNERIIFILKNDNLRVNVATSKSTYKPRERVNLDIVVEDEQKRPSSGNFSVSVTSDSILLANETTIFSNLLLSSDIKGYVENPNYYFTDTSELAIKRLDLLMLTQGFRRFLWKDISVKEPPGYLFKPEKIATEISGKLLTFSGKQATGRVNLMSIKAGFFADTIADNQGRFKFDNLLIMKDLEFTIQGRTLKNRASLKIVLDTIKSISPKPTHLLEWVNLNREIIASRPKDSMIESYKINSGKVTQLKEVKIRALKKRSYGNSITDQEADEIFKPDSSKPCKTLMECIEEMDNGRVRFVRGSFNDNGSTCDGVWMPRDYAVVIDNMSIRPCDYQELLLSAPDNIEKILFSHESYSISARLLQGRFKTLTPPAVMAIYTKNGNYRRENDDSIIHYYVKGFDISREFYSPKYDDPSKNDGIDKRTTLYWNASVYINASGRTNLKFFNSDYKGSYKVVLEGINPSGQLARQVAYYSVK